MSVTIRNISKSYGELRALDNISFTTGEGELFGVIGPDGAGKTTLFRILVTLLRPDTGSAQVGGFDVVKDYRMIRNSIGYMPGRFSLYHDLSVEENLAFYAKIFGTSISENIDFISDIYDQIAPFAKRRAGKLSGGMKQKLALSCALIHRPKILILDEPTTGVDAVSRKEFWDLLQKLKMQGITILVSTPYMDEAALCDRVALFQKGVMLGVENPGKLQFEDNTLLYILRTEDEVHKYLERIRSIGDTVNAWLFGNEIHIFLNYNIRNEAIAKIKKLGIPGFELKPAEPSVEDFFMHRMTIINDAIN